MSDTPLQQAERLYHVFAELVRAYQFRDREEVCCYGLSVSQCYALEALHDDGPQTMGALAARLYLDASTVTRLVDQLVAAEFAVRKPDNRDRRVCRVRISRKGRSLVARIRRALIEEQGRILSQVPPESREPIIQAMSLLLDALRSRSKHLPDDSSAQANTHCRAGARAAGTRDPRPHAAGTT